MTWITLTRVGIEVAATSSSAANPQLQFFENFPGHLGAGFPGLSYQSLSVHAVNIPLSISFNNVVVLHRYTGAGSRSNTLHFGLYSLNGSTLSLANSASAAITFSNNQTQWASMITSATQNITPGTWYFVMNLASSSGTAGWQLYMNSNINPGNAIPGGFLMGRATVGTAALPASIATSSLDITGSDATAQPYIIITA